MGISFEVDGDWKLNEAGTDLVLVGGVDFQAQSIKIGVETFQPFYIFDQRAGIPYFSEIFGRIPDLAAIRTILLDFMLGFDGVSTVDRLELTLDKESRILNVAYSVTTDTGESFSEDLIYGRTD